MGTLSQFMHWAGDHWWMILAVLFGELIGFSVPRGTRAAAFGIVVLTAILPVFCLAVFVACQWFINLVSGARVIATIGLILIAVAVCATVGLVAQKLLAKA